jgi:hypothetical protein
VFLAQKQRPGVNKLADLWKARPHYFYGVFIVYVRFAAAMMQSTRAVYQDKAGYLETARKWIKPIYQEHPDLMSNTYDTFVQERIWSVNNGLPKAWIDWTNQFNADLNKYKGAPPSYSALIDVGIATDALAKAGEVSPLEQ